MKTKDLSVLIVVILIVSMMIIPLPTLLLDFLLIFNISVSLLILLVAMNTKEALDFSIFPTVLLITTLFRLALNVSTTRSILSKADGGEVIETFGSFVIGGNPVVGFVVFLILVVIQFIVITKGSERVAEVAARFTLDAMPGKQMSIDADMNAGLITEQEARERRRKIEQESDFYGAMDGASKFVKGDAIAGIVILLINVIGGFIIGMSIHGMGFAEAASTFTLLSVGDGLVSQVPALLISTATGITVTRAASDGSLGSDIMRQIFNYPKLLYIVAATILVLGIFTPIGLFLTLPVAGILAFSAYTMKKSMQKEELQHEQMEQAATEEDIRSPEKVINLLQLDPLELEIGYGLIPLADQNQGGDILDRIVMIRRQFAIELGLVIPTIRIRDNLQLPPNQYVLKFRGSKIASGEVYLDHFLAMNQGEDTSSIEGIRVIEPAFGLPAVWVNMEEKQKAELMGYMIVDPPSVIATHLTEVLKRYAYELLRREETKELIENLKGSHPNLVEELVPNLMSVGDIQKVLQNLLREQISIRDLATIFETLADYAVYTKDPRVLTEYVRQSLTRQITEQYAENGVIQVLTAGATLEKGISDAIQQTESGSFYLSMDPQTSRKITEELQNEINRVIRAGGQPIFLTSPSIRMYLKQFVDKIMPAVPVLAYNELEPDVEIQSIGVVNI
ncbi:flagellar biosynthesis protein FlhA [Neobacillus sedimentimangrovi]|jgi:flagellar biosynthesis protein FlhA|uniref:Flagellar biosynthesis protein FlhA n=1 Tax=Neobacillus sedimentimangrovi TaxID=2699460 RepID=A0ABS8QK52_9BACI|nr:flagellar biosynthesis protein FlhA [Neobacillus sedimentimangrovi]MCD4839663.1 flagellar biosynthesis protein FlhA [Neobacillus sedimentimangrovi]